MNNLINKNIILCEWADNISNFKEIEFFIKKIKMNKILYFEFLVG